MSTKTSTQTSTQTSGLNCKYCNKIFASNKKSNFERHCKTEKHKKNVIKFESNEKLINETFIKEDILKECTLCNKKFKTDKGYNKHMKSRLHYANSKIPKDNTILDDQLIDELDLDSIIKIKEEIKEDIDDDPLIEDSDEEKEIIKEYISIEEDPLIEDSEEEEEEEEKEIIEEDTYIKDISLMDMREQLEKEKKILHCPNCKYETTDKSYLNKHKKTHSKYSNRCPVCDVTVNSDQQHDNSYNHMKNLINLFDKTYRYCVNNPISKRIEFFENKQTKQFLKERKFKKVYTAYLKYMNTFLID
jgi:hypothetical protein